MDNSVIVPIETIPAWQCHNEVVRLKTEIENNYLLLASRLKEMLDKGHFREISYKLDPSRNCLTMLEYAETIGYSLRKIEYLIRIESKFQECGISTPEIGWTKARLILPVISPANAEEWIDKARIKTVRELETEINATKKNLNIQDHKPITKVIISIFNEDDEKTVEDGFEMAAKVTGSNKRDVQLIAMCQEFVGTYSTYGDMIDDPIRRAILERDNYQCQCCGKRDNLDIHEIISKAKGGKISKENSVVVCRNCHIDITNGKMNAEKLDDGKHKFIRLRE